MWIQAESNIRSSLPLVASLNVSKVIYSSFLPRLCQLALILVVPFAVICGTANSAKAATLWYNGDPDGQGTIANQRFWLGARTLNRVVLEDFTVPTTDGAWQINTIWSNNVIEPQSTFTQVSWGILTVRPLQPVGAPFTEDRFIAGGRNPATITPTNFQASGQPVFRVSASGLNVRLEPGTYWLIVAPFYEYEDSYPHPPISSHPASLVATTSGSSAIGTPPGSNGNSFTAGYEPAFFPNDHDYSMGIEGEAVPEPASIFSVLTFGALSLGFRQWRKQKFLK
jgi:hypothetical protein